MADHSMSTRSAPFHPSLNVSPVPPFGGIPVELALQIINLVGSYRSSKCDPQPYTPPLLTMLIQITRKRDLASLGMACRSLRTLTLPPLYEHIYITDEKWSRKHLAHLTSRFNPASKEIRDITIIRRREPFHFFYPNWAPLFQSIAKDQLRSVRFICSSFGEFPHDFLDYMFRYQRNLATLDVRWSPRFANTLQPYTWPIAQPEMLTSLTISVNCSSHASMAMLVGDLLVCTVNLKHLSGVCCVHRPITAGAPETFMLSAVCVVQADIKLRLKSLTLTGCPRTRNSTALFCLTFQNIVDFSELESLTLRECMRTPSTFLGMVTRLVPVPKIKAIFIEGGYLVDADIATLHKFPNLERLVLSGVGALNGAGPHVGEPYTTHKAFLEMCRCLSQKMASLRTLCLETSSTGIGPTVVLNFIGTGRYKSRHNEVKQLIAHFPALEELWITLPVIPSTNAQSIEADVQNFLDAIAQAPLLRLVCNIRPNPRGKPPRTRDDDERSQFYEDDAWLPNIATDVFRQAAVTNPALRVFAVGYMPAGSHPGFIRAFVRRQKLLASGRFATVVEEVSAKELFLEEDFYFWNAFEQYEFKGQHGSPKLIGEQMDTSA